MEGINKDDFFYKSNEHCEHDARAERNLLGLFPLENTPSCALDVVFCSCRTSRPRSRLVQLEVIMQSSRSLYVHRCDRGTGICPSIGQEGKKVLFIQVGIVFLGH